LGQKVNRVEHLPVTIYGLQAKGLEPEQEPLDRMDDIVDLYLAQIIRAQEMGPLVLMGYCMGGYVAMELARRLWEQGRGEDVKSVVLINSYVTQKFTSLGVLDANGDFTIKGEIQVLESVFERENLLSEWGMTEEVFACFDHEQRMRYAYTKGLETEVIPVDITFDYVKRRFAVLAGLSKAMAFKTDAPLRTAIDNGFRIPVLCLIAKENIYDYQREWEDFGLLNVRYQYLPGDAATIFQSKHIENMARTIIAGTPVLAELETTEMAANIDD
jgi:pimeloyl-ACP methyl ester carboxylesterase